MAAEPVRTTVAYVTRRNKAWMISYVGNAPTDWPEGDQFDCAGSLSTAKRVARQGAKVFASNFRWVERPEVGGWTLEGVESDG